jgi:hypothetical protein
VTAIALALPGPAVAASDPSGNNGTIRVDGVEFDSLPGNEPHVGCEFQIDFYGFDEGDLHADVTFEAWAPSASPSDGRVILADRVPIGEDDASGGGSEAGLDASATYRLGLDGLAPGARGYHVRLTVEAEGSRGADTKIKVFWVAPCEPAPTATPGTTPTPTATVPPTPSGVSATTPAPDATDAGPSASPDTAPLATSTAGSAVTGGCPAGSVDLLCEVVGGHPGFTG